MSRDDDNEIDYREMYRSPRSRSGTQKTKEPKSQPSHDGFLASHREKEISPRIAPRPPNEDRDMRPAVPLKKFIVREVLRRPEVTVPELRSVLDEAGYRVSDMTMTTIRSETQFVVREAEALGLFGPFPCK